MTRRPIAPIPLLSNPFAAMSKTRLLTVSLLAYLGVLAACGQRDTPAEATAPVANPSAPASAPLRTGSFGGGGPAPSASSAPTLPASDASAAR